MTNAIKVLLQMTSVSLQPVPSLGSDARNVRAALIQMQVVHKLV
jgi:hypothetical protein